ncbi:hypothetical protein UFOVP112_389 [uncultured Caudovirales phage]|uniref:Uncharacterized protein n=1 Tax=uncultured Caudovirales phage TaxID=2100421 RepID=A0A6J5L4P8_9CAUD|nr:hypothetical protein UFOVP112_389 [uncultured Caudovirales phage]
MKIQLRHEGEPVADGLSVWHYRDASFGFILNLDRLYVWWRWSKKKRRVFCGWEYREPKAWRMLKRNNE